MTEAGPSGSGQMRRAAFTVRQEARWGAPVGQAPGGRLSSWGERLGRRGLRWNSAGVTRGSGHMDSDRADAWMCAGARKESQTDLDGRRNPTRGQTFCVNR